MQKDTFKPQQAGDTGTLGLIVAGGAAQEDIHLGDFYKYNAFNCLISARMNGTESTYTYQSDGLRHSKTVNGETTKHPNLVTTYRSNIFLGLSMPFGSNTALIPRIIAIVAGSADSRKYSRFA